MTQNIETETEPENAEAHHSEKAPEAKSETAEEQSTRLVNELHATEEHIDQLQEALSEEKAATADLREKMGLPPAEEESPSILADIAALAVETLLHTNEEVKIVEVHHAEQEVVEEEDKDKHLLMDLAFKFFAKLPEKDLESLVQRGLTETGHRMTLPFIGDVTPDVARIFVKAFKEGKHSFPMEALRKMGLLDAIEKKLEQQALEAVVDKILSPDHAHDLASGKSVLQEVVAGVTEGVVRAAVDQKTETKG